MDAYSTLKEESRESRRHRVSDEPPPITAALGANPVAAVRRREGVRVAEVKASAAHHQEF